MQVSALSFSGVNPVPAAPKRRFFKREDAPLYLMALPGAAALVIFSYLPMVGLLIAFQDFNVTKGVFGSSFVGMANFKFLFSTTDAFTITRNTVLYNLAFIIVNMVVAVALALMLSELLSRRTAKVLQTVYMLPYFLSWAVVAIVLLGFIERDYGMVNHAMGTKIDYYRQREIWPTLLVFVNCWKNVGYSTVLYLAVISGISHEYYEAAALDGATKLQQARYITIPHLRFILGVSLIMAMGNIFRGDFGLFYVVTRNTGRLYPVTDVIDTYIYRGLTSLGNVGMATAAGLYQSVVGFILVLAVNAAVTRIDPESAMF
ncbi:MAG: ABC transporter permease subunit [Oscillospiraceae bacterium]|jgi:putative aldouronate transport system permease protein|nr:ABC transporter permease subunit [Oscillospiraceae bacterium]